MTRRLIIEADGGSRGNPGPAGYGAVVRDADTGEVLAEVAEAIGRATNNVAEYRGLIAGLRAAEDLSDAPAATSVGSLEDQAPRHDPLGGGGPGGGLPARWSQVHLDPARP
jgi:hypothetical protein